MLTFPFEKEHNLTKLVVLIIIVFTYTNNHMPFSEISWLQQISSQSGLKSATETWNMPTDW